MEPKAVNLNLDSAYVLYARVILFPLVGGDCVEGQKARPNIDVTMDIEGRVIKEDGNGRLFLDKPSLEIRFGKKDAIR